MRLPEKKDLFLRELYRYKSERTYHDVQLISRKSCPIFTSPLSLQRMINGLKSDKLIELYNNEEIWKARLSKKGIAFCEYNSYAYPGYPIVVSEERMTYN